LKATSPVATVTAAAAGVLLAACLCTLAGCEALLPRLEAPTLKIDSVNFTGGDLRHQQLRLHVLADNPNARPLAVRSIDYDVALGGTPLAHGSSDAPFTLPASGSGAFDLNVDTDVGAMLRIVADHLGEPTLDYRVTGHVHLEAGLLREIPFTGHGQISLRN
jgi:LEA14-like dessication related protein